MLPRATAAQALVPVANHAENSAWRGAWVGWLACQTALLVVVEGTELAELATPALALRLAVFGIFVAAFARPCFPSSSARRAFVLAVASFEGLLAWLCERLPTDGSTGLVLFALGVFFIASRTTRLGLMEGTYSGLSLLTRWWARVAPTSSVGTGARPLQHRSAFGVQVWAYFFERLETQRRRCAHALNRERLRSMHSARGGQPVGGPWLRLVGAGQLR